MKPGQIIKTTYGRYYTILEIWDNIITTYEGQMVHVSNVVRVW